MIRQVQPSDIEFICQIYNHYVDHTVITFEEVPVSESEMEKRIEAATTRFPWLVYEAQHQIAGYAYAAAWKQRSAYRYAVETTIYLDLKHTGKGIGFQLYAQLINDLKSKGLHCAIGGIALPDDKSIALHEKLAFKKVAHFTEVGFKFNQWIDVGYWELILNDY